MIFKCFSFHDHTAGLSYDCRFDVIDVNMYLSIFTSLNQMARDFFTDLVLSVISDQNTTSLPKILYSLEISITLLAPIDKRTGLFLQLN